MPYYKISYESDSIEGLKAIQTSLSGNGGQQTGSSAFEAATPSPPPQMSDISSEGYADMLPPPTDADTGSADSSNDFLPPPSHLEGANGTTDNGDSNPPPPENDPGNQQDSETQPNENFNPPQPTSTRKPKSS